MAQLFLVLVKNKIWNKILSCEVVPFKQYIRLVALLFAPIFFTLHNCICQLSEKKCSGECQIHEKHDTFSGTYDFFL